MDSNTPSPPKMLPDLGARSTLEDTWPPVVDTGGHHMPYLADQFDFSFAAVGSSVPSTYLPANSSSPSTYVTAVSPRSSSYLSTTSSLGSSLSLFDTGRERSDLIRRLELLELASNPPISSTASRTETGSELRLSFGLFEPYNYASGSSSSTYDFMNRPSVSVPIATVGPDWSPAPGAAVASTSRYIPPLSSSNRYQQLDEFPVPERPCGSQNPAPTARLNAYPEKSVNFTNCQIRFTVHAMNIPLGVPLSSCKIEGLVITPSEKSLACRIFQVVKTNPYQMDCYTGTFLSTDEVGHYRLRVRLILPLEPLAVGQGAGPTVIYEDAQIVVSKNYYKDSQNYSILSFQLEFTPWQFPSSNGVNSRGYQQHRPPYFLSKAWGIACDKITNRFYCTDRSGHALTCLDPEGRTIYKLSRQAGNNSCNRPTGICCDQVNRRLIIADKDNHRISFFSMDGQYVSSFGGLGHANGCFNFPWDVAASPRGDQIVVSDSRNKRIQLFDREGNYVNKFSIYETNPFDFKDNFDYPRGVTFDNEGTFIYVTDFKTNHVVEIPINMSTYRKVLPSRKLHRPQGIVMDSLSNLLICDSKNQCVRHVSPTPGHLLSQIYSVGKERFQFPVNLTLMGDGRVAVIDSYGKIRIF